MVSAHDHSSPPSAGPAAVPRDSHAGTPPSAPTDDRRAPAPVSRWTLRLMAVGLLLAALNLRPAISGLGPLLAEVRAGFAMSGAVAGLLTSMPAVCFAVFGGLAPRLSRRHGPAKVVVAGMTAITLGLAVRPFTGSTTLFLATSILALAGIAVSNVLMPVVVQRWFPDRIGAMTGLYSMGLSLGTAGAAAVAVPLTNTLGGNWRLGLAAWALVGLVALVPWTVVLRSKAGRAASAARRGRTPEPAGPGGRGSGGGLRIRRSPTAWALGVYFGLQASSAYIIMGWLPQIFRDAGVPASTAGTILAATMGLGIPLSFVLPRLAARMSHQGPIAVTIGVCGLAGYTGLLLAPVAGAWLWALLIGLSNCAFPLVLTLIGMRARTGDGVTQLSAFAQSTGYLLSVPGPLLVGVLRDHSGGWQVPLLFMSGLMLAQVAIGVLAGRNRCVEDERGVRDC